MNIDKYLNSYEKYRNAVLGLKKAVDKLSRRKTAISGILEIIDCHQLENEYLKKKRILGYRTKKLQKAISRIEDPRMTDYLACKYIYGMTNDEIAECFNYCERQVYRIASVAKKRLSAAMNSHAPKPRRMVSRQSYKFDKKRKKPSLRKKYRKD